MPEDRIQRNSVGSTEKIFPLELCESTASLPVPNRPLSQSGFRNIYKPRIRTRSLSIGNAPKGLNNGFSTAILFRDANGSPVIQPLAAFSKEGVDAMEDDILNFFKCYKCYDLIPTSAKLVVLDTKLIVKKSFYAMVDTGVRACPLWDSERQEFIGMLTITDFIRILRNNYRGPGHEMPAFEEMRLCDVKGVNTEEPSDLFHMYPDSSLYDAAMTLIRRKIHRLPVIDPASGNILYVITQKPLLKFLYKFFPNLDKVSSLHKSISDACVGTFSDIKVATKDTKVVEALNRFVEEGISALPIVDDNGKLAHIYSKFDVINLAAEKTYTNLEITLEDANQHKTEYFDGVKTCQAKDSVFKVIEKLVSTDVARLVVVDDDQKVVGIVTVSDVIFFLLTSIRELNKFSRNSSTATAARREDSIGEEFEDLELSSCEDLPQKSTIPEHSCSPPRFGLRVKCDGEVGTGNKIGWFEV